jgi:hypothetical protein
LAAQLLGDIGTASRLGVLRSRNNGATAGTTIQIEHSDDPFEALHNGLLAAHWKEPHGDLVTSMTDRNLLIRSSSGGTTMATELILLGTAAEPIPVVGRGVVARSLANELTLNHYLLPSPPSTGEEEWTTHARKTFRGGLKRDAAACLASRPCRRFTIAANPSLNEGLNGCIFGYGE